MRKELYQIQRELCFNYKKLLDIKSKRAVFLIEENNTKYVLKIEPKHIGYLAEENTFLTENNDLEAITKRVDNMITQTYYALVKEYFPGEHPNTPMPTTTIKQLEKTIQEIHQRGYAGLDIAAKNIILSTDNQQAKIIDCDVYKRPTTHQDKIRLQEKDNKELALIADANYLAQPISYLQPLQHQQRVERA